MIDASWYQRPANVPVRVTAGGIVVRKEAEKIFIALILEGSFSKFALPKGGVKRGETIEMAARREILEEAGIRDLELIETLGKRERLNFSKTRWTVVHYFLFTTEQKDGTPTDQSKRHVLKWFPLDSLPPMAWPEQRRLIEENREKIRKLGILG